MPFFLLTAPSEYIPSNSVDGKLSLLSVGISIGKMSFDFISLSSKFIFFFAFVF